MVAVAEVIFCLNSVHVIYNQPNPDKNICHCSCDFTSKLTGNNWAFILYLVCQAWWRMPTSSRVLKEEVAPTTESPGGKGSAGGFTLLLAEYMQGRRCGVHLWGSE